jgi:diguanylate cyclase (GGDEF)-like protein/PAS domain S-box-containing protein
MPEDKDFYKNIIDNLYDGVYFVDRERVITYWNKGAERITGYTSQQVVGHSCRDNLLNHISADGVQLCLSRCPLAICMEAGSAQEADVFLHHADGHRLPVLVRAAPLRDNDGNIIGAVEIFTGDVGDATVRQELRELRGIAPMDKLTNIGNREFIEGRVRAVIAELEHQPKTAVGLLFMDIDHLKECNDRHGRHVGDRALSMVAATLRHNLRNSDLVGRWGGDEFLAILYDVTTSEMLKSVSKKLRMLVEFSRLDFFTESLTVTISAGATLLLPTDTPESVVRRVDDLLYQSKRAGGNQVSVG